MQKLTASSLQALKNETDIVICDTSGRLHTNYKLMEELAKSYQVIQKKSKTVAAEVLLVLDGTTGKGLTLIEWKCYSFRF